MVVQALGALVIQAVKLQVSLSLLCLGLGRGQRGFRLLDLVASLVLLEFQGSFGFTHLRGRPPLGVEVIRLVRAQFLRVDDGE